ncbi:MAG: hypothetical protein U9N62_01385 [Thermotogota bacterium]|nr:hypothetical protein [Thermotogota bacterium]
MEWNKGFQNIENVQEFIISNQLNDRNMEFLHSISERNNCDLTIIEALFRSKIIIISDEIDHTFFDETEVYLFNIQKIYSLVLEGLNNGILIVKAYEGLEEFLEIISKFDVQFLRQGDYLIASKNTENFTEYQKNMVNRNEFSEDILIYAETKEKNLTITNAFSFLNIEIKTMNPINEIPQFPIQIIEIPLEFESPERLFIFANQKIKDFFYSHFEVISSIDEWQMIYELIDKLCVYGFYYQFSNQWLIGFKSQNMFYENDSFQNQISKWGIDQTETIKPFANSYYLSVVNDFFLISNFKPEKVIELTEDFRISPTLLDLQEKIGKREVYEVGYDFIEELGFPYYFFSTSDDKISKQVMRIF